MIDAPFVVEGVVVDTSDPQEMGRLRVWCPAIDGDVISDVETLPWASYLSPFAGQAYSYPGGGGGTADGPMSYGFWAIPKIGAQVLVMFLYGDYNQRVYIGSVFREHGNRSLPVGRNDGAGNLTTDSGGVIEPAASNLKAQFGDLSSSIAQTRGAYERQAAQPADEKNSTEGYQTRAVPVETKGVGELESQTFCITTPGRHAILMQDNPANSRLRFKTAEGHQIIFDDANERIYLSVAGGQAYLEIDKDGHVHLFAAESVSIAAGGNLNLAASGSVNISAGTTLNLLAGGDARLTACGAFGVTGAGVNITSGAAMNFLASGNLLATGSAIHLNGPSAAEAACATAPTIVPQHEPWEGRPASSSPRGPHWKK